MPALQTSQPQLYENLSRHLSETDQAILQNVVTRAEALEREQATIVANGGAH